MPQKSAPTTWHLWSLLLWNSQRRARRLDLCRWKLTSTKHVFRKDQWESCCLVFLGLTKKYPWPICRVFKRCIFKSMASCCLLRYLTETFSSCPSSDGVSLSHACPFISAHSTKKSSRSSFTQWCHLEDAWGGAADMYWRWNFLSLLAVLLIGTFQSSVKEKVDTVWPDHQREQTLCFGIRVVTWFWDRCLCRHTTHSTSGETLSVNTLFWLLIHLIYVVSLCVVLCTVCACWCVSPGIFKEHTFIRRKLNWMKFYGRQSVWLLYLFWVYLFPVIAVCTFVQTCCCSAMYNTVSASCKCLGKIHCNTEWRMTDNRMIAPLTLLLLLL